MVKKIEQSEIQALPDALTNEAYTLVFGSIPGSSDSRRLTLQCKTFQMPAFTNEKVEVMLAGYQKRQSGTNTNTGSISSTFLETKDMAVLSLLRTWMQNARGTYTNSSIGYSDTYTRTGELTVFDSTGAVSTTCKIFKMWPSEISEIALDSSNPAQAVEVSVTWSYDYCEYGEQTTL